jgi:hypothetical protein
MRRKGAGDGARIVIGASDGISDDVANRLRILSLVEKIGGNPRRTGDRQAAKVEALLRGQPPLVDADIDTPGLPPGRNRELMAIRGEMPQAVQRGGRPVGHNPLLRSSPPRRDVGGELQPRGTQLDVIGHRSPCKTVHAVGDPIEDRT